MKISKIEKIEDVYHVTFVPNFIEKLFGVKETTERFKRAYGRNYRLTGDPAWIYSDGSILGATDTIVKELTKFDRKF